MRSACSEGEPVVRIGVVGERVPVDGDLADDEMVVRPGASSFDRDVVSCPPCRRTSRRRRASRAHPASFAGKTTTHPAQIPQEVAGSPRPPEIPAR